VQRLDQFDPKIGLDRGRPKYYEMVWYLAKCCFFLSALPWPSSFKCRLLRIFGAKVGEGVVIKPRVNIHFPWKLEIGDHTWIGEEVFILNFEPCTIGAHCCISQRAFLCGGNHDFRAVDFAYRNGPISIEDGAWVGAQTFIAPNVTVAEEAVITAGAIVTESMPAQMICSGNPCQAIKPRYKASE
jgi:putative colanic acid biosynthesis acetyltransferase WcaF